MLETGVPGSGRTVDVQLGLRSYSIQIGRGFLDQAGMRIATERARSHAVIIYDQRVEAYARRVAEGLTGAGLRTDLLAVPSGERSKSVAEAERLWNGLLACHADRASVVVAVGGGVVGDLAGFVAATFARGLDLIQVPTTLLAQVDSSVGGKVGVNLPGAKNMVGAFWQPRLVLIDPDVLATLEDREYRAGLAEVVKYAVILDAEFFGRLEQAAEALDRRDASVLVDVIAHCCRLKAQVVQQDEREETGHRAVLNYGHTFAHGLEATTGYTALLHGEAVSIGMMYAARLAQRLGRVDEAWVERQQRLLERLRLPCRPQTLDVEAMLQAMRHDKKVERGRLRFVLPVRLGHVELVSDVDPELVRAVLDDG